MTALLFAAALAVSAAESDTSMGEVTIKAKAAVGPAIVVPPPRADRAVVDEVIRTLDLGRSAPLEQTQAMAKVSAASKRLSRPFPEPPFLTLSPRAIDTRYDGWSFEVLEENKVLWKADGVGELREPLEWDGTGPGGELVARVEAPYSFRFVGKGDGAPIVLVSEPIKLDSLLHRDFLGTIHLEAASALIFAKGKAEFAERGRAHVAALAERMRRVPMGGDPYKFTLYEDDPRAELSKARARLVRRRFAKELLVAPERVHVDVLTAGARGRALVCQLPPEKGDTIGGGL